MLPHASAIAHAQAAEAPAIQEPAVQSSAAQAQSAEAKVDIITPHITDGHHLELPYWKPPFYKEVHLPEWEPVQLGPVAVDLSPTKHVVFMWLAAIIVIGIRFLVAPAAGASGFGLPANVEGALQPLRSVLGGRQ